MSQHQHPEGFRPNLFDIPFQYFRKHLERPDNFRILFSGKFGAGKTYFLEHFFKNETQAEKLLHVSYRAYHLFPVNYSIAANDDIFGYLKYDILRHFLASNVTIEQNDLVESDFLPIYVRKNILNVFARLAAIYPPIHKRVDAVLTQFKALKTDFEEKVSEAIKDESRILGDYLERIENSTGSLYENDLLTQIIARVLAREKAKTGRENILIIDDLDRIDPEHVFRILNVFAAHLDSKTNLANKLGFDKVLIVCDVHNLRSIFAARYGIGSDFNGYIDKFYSFEVFDFNNRSVMEDIAIEALYATQFVPVQGQDPNYFRRQYFNRSGLAVDLLTHLVQTGNINLRVLINRIEGKPEQRGYASVAFGPDDVLRTDQHPLLFTMNILRQLVGDYQSLRERVKKIPRSAWRIYRVDFYCKQMLYYSHFVELRHQKPPASLTFNNRTFSIPSTSGQQFNFDDIKEQLPSDTVAESHPPNFTLAEFFQVLDLFLDSLSQTLYEE